jgi:hypothetical protein
MKICEQCGQKATAKVKMPTGQVILMCRECVDSAKTSRAGAATPTSPSKAAPAAPSASAPPATMSPRGTQASSLSARKPATPAPTPAAPITPAEPPPVDKAKYYKEQYRQLHAVHTSTVEKLQRERDDALRQLSQLSASQSTQTANTVRRAAQRAVVAEEQASSLQAELEAAVQKNGALTKQLAVTCDRLADVEAALARINTSGKQSADSAADEQRLAEARAAREHAETERDLLQTEYDKATETARKRLEFAAQLVVELETKVDELSNDLADKAAQVESLKHELDAALMDNANRGADNDDDDDAGSDDGVDLSAIPVLFGPGATTTASAAAAAAATDDESMDSASAVSSSTKGASEPADDTVLSMWKIRAERAESECSELRARLEKTEERLDAVQERLVALMTDAVDRPSTAEAHVEAAPIAAPGPPPPPPPMPAGPLVKNNTALKIGTKTDTSRTALARANNVGMDHIFEKIKSGGVALRKVASKERTAKPPSGNAFDQMVQQIKAKNYKINAKILKEQDGRLRFREPPKSVRPPDVNEKRVLLDPRTGKPLGDDVEIGGPEPRVLLDPRTGKPLGADVEIGGGGAAAGASAKLQEPELLSAAANVVEIADSDDDDLPPLPPIDIDELDDGEID